MPEQPLIELKNLSHRFPNGAVGIEKIDLRINAGEFIVLAGQNGSGKTTLLRHLNGLLLPTGGAVYLDGKPAADAPKRARRLVGMVFQDADSQIVGETVFDDVAFGPENLKLPQAEIKSRVIAALSAVGLSEKADTLPHLLSGGEKRRLAIAGVLAMQPKILVFDEPFSNLDHPGVQQVLRQILLLHNTGQTILITTHDIEKVIAHANRLIILHNGRAVLDGPPEKLMNVVEEYGIRQPCAVKYGFPVTPWLS